MINNSLVLMSKMHLVHLINVTIQRINIINTWLKIYKCMGFDIVVKMLFFGS